MTESGKALILVVDDMPEVGQLVKMFVESAGYEVMTALDPKEALEQAGARPPDLVICDVVLPSMMGWDLCLKLKQLASPRYLPVIMLTAKATELDEMRSFEAQADEHFSKPPDFKKLIAAVGKHLAAQGAH